MAAANYKLDFQFTVPDITVQPDDMTAAGEYMVNSVKSRALAGVDYLGRPFAPYSAAYAKRKGSGTVNLRGPDRAGRPHMIDTITYQAVAAPTGGELRVGIFNDERAAMVAESINEGKKIKTRGSGTNPRRRFRGIKDYLTIPPRPFLTASREDLAQVYDLVFDHIVARITR